MTDHPDDHPTHAPSADLLSTLLGRCESMVMVLDASGTILFASPSVRQKLGYDPEELVGMRVFDLVHSEDVPSMRTDYERRLNEPEVEQRSTRRFRHKDGSWRILESTGHNHLTDPAVRGIIVNSHDVTEVTRTKEALEKNRQQLAEAQRVAGVGSWEWDVQRNHVTWSDELYRIYGYAPGEFGASLEAFLASVHPDDRSRVEAIVAKSVETGIPLEYEFRAVQADGEVRVLNARGERVTGPGGEVLLLRGTVQDITVDKEVEAELRRAKQEAERSLSLFAATLESTADGILVVDTEGTVQTANDRFSEQWGIPDELLTGGDDRRMIEHVLGQLKDPGEFLSKIEELYSQPEAESFDTLEFKDGRIFERFSKPQRIDGRVVGRVWSFRDVTAEVRAEEALIEAKEQAEAASQAKSEFLSSMSHELRTPLNSVIGFANILQKNKAGNLRAQDLTFIERIAGNGKHLLEMINDLLDISKIEAGKMEVEIEPVDLGRTVEETLEQLRGTLRGHEVSLRADIAEDMAPVETDPGKLKQVLINLVGNAIKFTERGSVTVVVESDPQTGRPVRIDVRDTGVGIAQDRLTAIFDAFEQGESGTSRRYEGTGLGLTITRAICDLLGYRLEVESEPGRGSTFSVILTQDRGRPAGRPRSAGLPEQASAIGEGEESADIAGGLVLVIDDEIDSRMLLTHHIEELGCRTITASSGRQGISMARRFRPALITLDLLLPGMSGWEILHELKADPELCDIPVVVVSIVAEENRGSVSGAVDILPKPIDRDSLLAVLQRNLGNQRRRVLVVEDDRDTRDLLTAYLEEEGAEVRAAEDGGEGLRVLDDFVPDLIVLDLLMPRVDGREFLKRLRSDPAHRHIPVVIATAKDLSGDEQRGLLGRCDAVLHKDASLEDELRTVMREINRGGARLCGTTTPGRSKDGERS